MQQRSGLIPRSGLPLIAAGLFVGRLLSEWAPFLTGHSVVGIILVSLVCLAALFFLLRKISFEQTWPLLFLLVYVFYPEANPETAVFTLLFVCALYFFQLVRPWRITIPLLATAVAFATLYILTLAPDILPADNGEFQLIAANLGVAHPPGFSLYTLLAHLMTRLPLASAAYEVNLLSALTSVLTLIVVYLTVYHLTKFHGAALTAVVALGTATTFWAQATTANIRSLTGLFASLMIFTLVRFYENSRGAGEQGSRGENYTKNDRWLIYFVLALSFGVVHHASLAFMGLVFVVWVIVKEPSILRTPRRWIRPFLAGLAGLLPLLYFPLRAGANVRGASAGLATWDGFLNHILALGFRGDLFHFIQLAELWARFQVMGNVLTFQFHPILLLGMAFGMMILLWRDRQLALLLGGSFALHTLITATYRAPQTVEYMLPAYVPLVVGLGYGIGKVAKWQVAGGKIGLVLAALVGVTAVYQGWQHYPSFAELHRDNSARDYTQAILQNAPSDSTILADWHWATPLWYLQEVENQQPDVAVRFVFPEGESYATAWAQRIEAELGNGRPVIATHFDENAYAILSPPEPFHNAYLFHQQPRTTLPDHFTPLDLILNDEIHLLGYQLEDLAVEIAQETTITIAWKPISNLQSPVSLFIHLVGFDGQLYAQDDLQAEPQAEGITLTQFRLTPRLGAAPGDFAIMLGQPNEGDNRITLTNLTVTAMSRPLYTQNQVYRTVPGERPLLRLIGYDWDNTLDTPRLYLHWQTEHGFQTEVRDDISPDGFILSAYFGPWGVARYNQQLINNNQQIYVPFGQGIIWAGTKLHQSPVSSLQTLTLKQTFYSSRPVLHDLVVSVRLIGYKADDLHWAWWELDDWIPALGAIPTLKWVTGSAVTSPHTLPVNEAAQPGQAVGATLRLYDAFTNRPLPILDNRITNDLQLSWVPLGQTTITE